MAVGILLDITGGTQADYEALNEQIFGTQSPEPPEGLIMHTAGATATGWRIVDVWESREEFERFIEDHVTPAAQALGQPMDARPEIWEIQNKIVGHKAAV